LSASRLAQHRLKYWSVILNLFFLKKERNENLMIEQWKMKGTLFQELDALRSRVAQFEQTESKRRDKELEHAFKTIFDDATDGMLLVKEQNRQFITGNKVICQMLYYDLEELTNLKVKDIHPREDLGRITKQFEKQVNRDLMLSKKIPVKRKDGSIFYADVCSLPVSFSGETYLMTVFRATSPKNVSWILQQNTSTNSFKGKPLTTSEIKIFELIANGMSNKKIADLLGRSIRTIEWHRNHIMHKLGVDNPADLLKQAALMGLIDLPAKHSQHIIK